MLSPILLLAFLGCDSDTEAPTPSTPPSEAPVQVTPAPVSVQAKKAVTPPQRTGPLQWEQLRAERAEATSFLRSNWNKYNENYHPNYVLDGNPKTAWVEGAEGNGEGQELILPLSGLQTANRVKLRIRNGYQKSDGLLAANAAPAKVTITARHHGNRVGQKSVELKRENGWQEVIVDLDAGAGVDNVALRVDSVHPGSRYKDTCISDIEVFVESTIPYNAAQEQKHHDALMAWVTERVETAKYFAGQPVDYPFAATHFTSKSGDGNPASVGDQLSAARSELKRMRENGPWYRMSVSRRIPSFPDGLYMADALLPLFTPAEVTYFETEDALGDHKKEEEGEEGYIMWSQEIWRSNARVDFAAPNRPRTVYFWEKIIEEGRGTYESKVEYVVHYTDDGVVDWIYSSSRGSSEIGPEHNERLLTFQRAERKVAPAQALLLNEYEMMDEKFHASIVSYGRG
ncbi:MAG: hypothetical protein AAFV53_01550 [Myxococcota bacterium]